MSDNSKILYRKDLPDGHSELVTTCAAGNKDGQELLGEVVVAAACFLGAFEAKEIVVRIDNGMLTCLVDGEEQARGLMTQSILPMSGLGHA